MASMTAQVQTRLARHCRWLLLLAGLLAKYTPVRIPHKWVLAVYCRSWSMRINNGPWLPLRIDAQGRPLNA